ncbi:DctP family TRAP transporter solute-binding subunit [Hwanghaeella sp.]|uniref:DctP family TRAP transporter solute-binding subunit n=1 Tax=Hwanghaeella sp. TaxID=2605943 RepID=UPI003CCB923C
MRIIKSLVSAGAIVLALTLPAAAQTELKIGWTTSDGETDPYAIAAREFISALEKNAPGQFTGAYFPNRQLGDEREMLEGLGFGTLDVAVITNAVIANIEPAFQLNDMPFLYGNEAQAHEVLDGEIGQELLGRLDDNGIVGLAFAEGGFRHMINNVRPVTTPADVGGVKYRVMQNPVFVGMFQSLGGNAVPMAWGEVYTAVQQGTIDGLEIPIAVIKSNNYAEVAKYLSLTRHTYSALGILISKRTFDRLSPELQEAVRISAKEAVVAQRAAVASNNENIVASLRADGMEVNDVADPAEFRSLVKPVYEQFRDSIGGDLLDAALAQVK